MCLENYHVLGSAFIYTIAEELFDDYTLIADQFFAEKVSEKI